MPHGPCQYVLAQDETKTEEKAPIEKKKHSIKKEKNTHTLFPPIQQLIGTNSQAFEKWMNTFNPFNPKIRLFIQSPLVASHFLIYWFKGS